MSTMSSHDLTPHPCGKASFDQVIGLGTEDGSMCHDGDSSSALCATDFYHICIVFLLCDRDTHLEKYYHYRSTVVSQVVASV